MLTMSDLGLPQNCPRVWALTADLIARTSTSVRLDAALSRARLLPLTLQTPRTIVPSFSVRWKPCVRYGASKFKVPYLHHYLGTSTNVLYAWAEQVAQPGSYIIILPSNKYQ